MGKRKKYSVTHKKIPTKLTANFSIDALYAWAKQDEIFKIIKEKSANQEH